MDLLAQFAYALLLDTPTLALVVVGAVVAWIKLARTHRAAFAWAVTAFATLGVQRVIIAFERVQRAAAFEAGTRPSLTQSGLWTLAILSLFWLTIVFLLVAVVSNRVVRRSEPWADRS